MTYKYDSCGLFIGLLTFPFYVDGRDLYVNCLRRFFDSHRHYLAGHCPQNADSVVQDDLYVPAGYRMFGKHGLAVIALQDDLAFSSRIFNTGHINPSLVQGPALEQLGNVKCVVISGTSETEVNEGHIAADGPLPAKAKSTFLRTDNRYPFIGIIRMKINNRLLGDKGVCVIWKIKAAIRSILRRCRGILWVNKDVWIISLSTHMTVMSLL